MRFSYVLFIAIIFAVTGYSCKERGGKFIDQGEIHYNIDYVGDFGVPKEFLPKNLIVSFKNDKILYDMSGLGNSGIFNLINPEKGIYDTYFSILQQNFIMLEYRVSCIPGFDNGRNGFKENSQNFSYLRLQMQKCRSNLPASGDTTYNIWYTNEIKIKNPNASTPFNQIDGVLMSFFFFIGTIRTSFFSSGSI